MRCRCLLHWVSRVGERGGCYAKNSIFFYGGKMKINSIFEALMFGVMMVSMQEISASESRFYADSLRADVLMQDLEVLCKLN